MRSVRMRRVLGNDSLRVRIGDAFLRKDESEGKPLQLEKEGENGGRVQRNLAVGHAAFVVSDLTTDDGLLLGEPLLKLRADALVCGIEQGEPVPDCSRIVEDDLPLPFRVEKIGPFLG